MHIHIWQSVALLSGFWASTLAERAGALHERSDISPRQQQCLRAGWIPVCPGALPCIPPSGTCCSGNYYHLPGGRCPTGYSEVPRIGQSALPPASITPAATPSATPVPPVIEYRWYSYTITYYYYYYYYYYVAATYQLTSTRTTEYTTISLTASNQAAANSEFRSVSAAATFATPVQAATPTLGSPSPTLGLPSSSTSTSSVLLPTRTSAVPSPSISQSVSIAGSLRAGGLMGPGSRIGFIMGALVLALGVSMILL